MDSIKALKKIILNKKPVTIIGVESNRLFWAEALTTKGVIRSFANSLERAVSNVELAIKKSAA